MAAQIWGTHVKKQLFVWLTAILSNPAYGIDNLALWVKAVTPLAILQLLKLSSGHFNAWVDALVAALLPVMGFIAPGIVVNDQVVGIVTDQVAEALQRVIDTTFGVLL